MSDTSEQLVSFFLYSLLIYPVTNYLISPQRSYPRWKAALYAVAFLSFVTVLHLAYENQDKGPNHYQLIGVTRDTPLAVIKKAYRVLSLEVHPDKNSAPDAADQFNRLKTAYDVLVDQDRRKEYNRLGDYGVKTSAQMVIDHKVIILQLIVYYCSSLVFAFLMTFTESTSDAMQLTVFGLAVMLMVEMVLVLHNIPLPSWFLPSYTSHDVIAVLHRVFPAYMNACRCVTGAFYVDRKALYVQCLDSISNVTKDLTMRCNSALQLCESITERYALTHGNDQDESSEGTSPKEEQAGIMAKAMADIRRHVAQSREGRSGAMTKFMTERLAVLKDPRALAKQSVKKEGGGRLALLRDLAIYLLARFLLIKGK